MVGQTYNLQKEEGVLHYILNQEKIFDKGARLTVTEIGNGNMNYVYRIQDTANGKSIILKYAGEHIRISEEILVSPDRIKIEAGMLDKLSKLVPDCIPQIYQFDELNNCILMQDLKGYTIMREALVNHIKVQNFAENIVAYLIKSLLPTSEILLKSLDKDELAIRFSNPHLCEITRTYVLIEPFDILSDQNAIFEPNRDYINRKIFQDKWLLQEVEQLRETFDNKKQALLHGDLHTGSVFIKDSSIVIFDYEFAFYGPIGFDIGNLIANLIFAWLHEIASEQVDYSFLHWMEETIEKVIDLFRSDFIDKLSCLTTSYEDLTEYMEAVIKDTASFAGVELIRRIVGLAHVKDIISIPDTKSRTAAERAAIDIGKEYILNKEAFKNGDHFVSSMKKSAGKHISERNTI